MSKVKAFAAVGGLSKPSKMPGYGYSLPASLCKTGSKLRKVEGSVCSKCYACRGNYLFPNVRESLANRAKLIKRKGWIADMVRAVEASGTEYFRWHDSGDLQSRAHFWAICEIARLTPNVGHWMPTKERTFVSGNPPRNLVVRISAPMIGADPPKHPVVTTSSTVSSGVGFACPATRGAKSCDAAGCRACWDRRVKNVDYLKH